MIHIMYGRIKNEHIEMQDTQRLILFLFAQAQEMHLKDIVEIGLLFGKSSSSVRACVNRLARNGMVTREGSARKAARYRLSSTGKVLAHDVVMRFMKIHALVEASQSWDGTWTLVSFDIPERIRKRRDEFRAGLRQMGFGHLAGSVWIAPGNSLESANSLARSLRVEKRIVTSLSKDVSIGGDSISMAISKIWPLSQINREYSAMRVRMKSRIDKMRARICSDSPPDAREAFIELFIVFSEAAELIAQDPCLPTELLPSNWLGLEVQDLIHEYFHLIHGLELKDTYSYLLELPAGLSIPLPRNKRRRT
jgi:phenylacetic acid degradation operon negative regulatory protein